MSDEEITLDDLEAASQELAKPPAKPKKIFKPGDIVQFDYMPSHFKNPDGFLVVDKAVSAAFKKEWPHTGADEVDLIGLNDGNAYSQDYDKLNHTFRIKGKDYKTIPMQAWEANKGQTVKLKGCPSESPENGNGNQWACEREKGHPGDHMAWESWPHVLYEGGVWKTKEDDSE